MDNAVRRRLKWVRMYAENADAGLTCRRCGISRPTLRLGARRYSAQGEVGLHSHSRRPRNSPRQRVFAAEQAQILALRRDRNLGARRIQIELRLVHRIELSITRSQRVLSAERVPPWRRPRRAHPPKRYARPTPGERVQLDTMKVAAAVYQYTADDDCSRFRVLGVYPRRNSANTLRFLERVVEEMPFAIQRIQTDRGGEFFAESVQRWLMRNFIKFRPIRPRSPHLNGKVERSQLTDLQEFWIHQDYRDLELNPRIEEWQFDYNWRRPHGSPGGRTPIERTCVGADSMPLRADVALDYDASRERLRHRDYKHDQKLGALHAAGALKPQ